MLLKWLFTRKDKKVDLDVCFGKDGDKECPFLKRVFRNGGMDRDLFCKRDRKFLKHKKGVSCSGTGDLDH